MPCLREDEKLLREKQRQRETKVRMMMGREDETATGMKIGWDSERGPSLCTGEE